MPALPTPSAFYRTPASPWHVLSTAATASVAPRGSVLAEHARVTTPVLRATLLDPRSTGRALMDGLEINSKGVEPPPPVLCPPGTSANYFMIETRSTCFEQPEEQHEFAAQPHGGDTTANSSNSSGWAQQVDRASIIK